MLPGASPASPGTSRPWSRGRRPAESSCILLRAPPRSKSPGRQSDREPGPPGAPADSGLLVRQDLSCRSGPVGERRDESCPTGEMPDRADALAVPAGNPWRTPGPFPSRLASGRGPSRDEAEFRDKASFPQQYFPEQLPEKSTRTNTKRHRTERHPRRDPFEGKNGPGDRADRTPPIPLISPNCRPANRVSEGAPPDCHHSLVLNMRAEVGYLGRLGEGF